jgi:hypothetical protein
VGRSQKIRWSLAFEAEPARHRVRVRSCCLEGCSLALNEASGCQNRAVDKYRRTASFFPTQFCLCERNAIPTIRPSACRLLSYRSNNTHHGPQVNERCRLCLRSRVKDTLNLRHAILHRSGKTAAYPGAIRRRSDWLPVRRLHPTTAPGSLIPAPPRKRYLLSELSHSQPLVVITLAPLKPSFPSWSVLPSAVKLNIRAFRILGRALTRPVTFSSTSRLVPSSAAFACKNTIETTGSVGVLYDGKEPVTWYTFERVLLSAYAQICVHFVDPMI